MEYSERENKEDQSTEESTPEPRANEYLISPSDFDAALEAEFASRTIYRHLRRQTFAHLLLKYPSLFTTQTIEDLYKTVYTLAHRACDALAKNDISSLNKTLDEIRRLRDNEREENGQCTGYYLILHHGLLLINDEKTRLDDLRSAVSTMKSYCQSPPDYSSWKRAFENIKESARSCGQSCKDSFREIVKKVFPVYCARLESEQRTPDKPVYTRK